MTSTWTRWRQVVGGAALAVALAGLAGQATVPPSTAATTDAPALTAPAANATYPKMSVVDFTWQLPAGSTQYHLQVTPYNGDGPAVNLVRNAATGYTLAAPVLGEGPYVLLPAMTYTWRVRATDKPEAATEGDPAWGPWSTTRSFATGAPTAAGIQAAAPTTGATGVSANPTLTWTDTTLGTFYYEVQLSRDAGFTTDARTATAPVYTNLVHGGQSQPLNSWTVPTGFGLDPGATYSWRVRPRVQGNGQPVAWSPRFTFQTAGRSTPTRVVNGQTVYVPSRIFVVVLENHEYGQIIGNPDAPYLNQLASQFAVADRYYGVRHPSLPNYIALLGGDTLGITSDCTTCRVNAPNLVDLLEQAGRSWGGYFEGLPASCNFTAQAGNYVMRHNPFYYFQNLFTNQARCQRVRPFTQFAQDLAAGTLPDFVWLGPDMQHSMHDAPVATGDQWLRSVLAPLLASPTWQQDSMVVVLWDEGTTDLGWNGGAGGGRIPALFLAPFTKPGLRVSTPATHYHLLRTIEDVWGLGRVGQTADAAMTPLLAPFAAP